MKRGSKTLSVPVHANHDLPTGMLHKLLKESGLSRNIFIQPRFPATKAIKYLPFNFLTCRVAFRS